MYSTAYNLSCFNSNANNDSSVVQILNPTYTRQKKGVRIYKIKANKQELKSKLYIIYITNKEYEKEYENNLKNIKESTCSLTLQSCPDLY